MVIHQSKSSLNAKTALRVYFNGCKNTLCSIQKNASFIQMILLLPMAYASWICIASYLFLNNNRRGSTVIMKAFWANSVTIFETLKKR